MRSLKFRALVTMNTRTEPPRPPTNACSLVIRGHRHRPERVKGFNAMIATEDEEPLRPGDAHHIVTMTVTDEEAIDFLLPGEHFELWGRSQVGHGIVSRRVLV